MQYLVELSAFFLPVLPLTSLTASPFLFLSVSSQYLETYFTQNPNEHTFKDLRRKSRSQKNKTKQRTTTFCSEPNRKADFKEQTIHPTSTSSDSIKWNYTLLKHKSKVSSSQDSIHKLDLSCPDTGDPEYNNTEEAQRKAHKIDFIV